MKRIIKKKWFLPVVVPVVLVIVCAIMFLFGWRITYAPELDNSWDAISAVAAWASIVVAFAGVIASFAAVWFAICVPKKIAENQNKIALFEKRYRLYILLDQGFRALQLTQLPSKKERACQVFYQVLLDNYSGIHDNYINEQEPKFLYKADTQNEYMGTVMSKIVGQFIFDMHQIHLLFDDISEKDVQVICDAFSTLWILYGSDNEDLFEKSFTDDTLSSIDKTIQKVKKQTSIN